MPSWTSGASASELERWWACSDSSKSVTVVPSRTEPARGMAPAAASSVSTKRGLAGASGSDQDDVPDPVRAARLEILPGWSPGATLVRHRATSTSKATPVGASAQGVSANWPEDGRARTWERGSPPPHGVSGGLLSTFDFAPSEVDAHMIAPRRPSCLQFSRGFAGARVRAMNTTQHQRTETDDLPLLPPERLRLYIDGEWREANDGARFEVHDPADGSVVAEVADGSPLDAMDALDAAVAAQARLGTHAAARPGRDPAPGLRAAHRAGRRLRAPDDPRDGQAAGRGEGRGRLRLGVLPLVRRGGGPDPRSLDAGTRTAPAGCSP